VKITTLSHNALEALALRLGLDKNAFTANTGRSISIDHATARFAESNTIDYWLRQASPGVSQAAVGELQEVTIITSLSSLYEVVNSITIPNADDIDETSH
jgi:hypothetical protein